MLAPAAPWHEPHTAPAGGTCGQQGSGARHSARFIGLADRAYVERLDWIERWIDCESAFVFRHWDSRQWSQAASGFQILVLHGEDAERVALIVRDARRMFPDKLILAVMARTTPAARTLCLRAGADAVFCPANGAEVAAAWLETALDRRVRLQSAQAAGARNAALTRQEQRIMQVLRQHGNGAAPYAQIVDALERPLTPHAVRAIQVAMCKLNKKIAGTGQIRNVPGTGYRLELASMIS